MSEFDHGPILEWKNTRYFWTILDPVIRANHIIYQISQKKTLSQFLDENRLDSDQVLMRNDIEFLKDNLWKLKLLKTWSM